MTKIVFVVLIIVGIVLSVVQLNFQFDGKLKISNAFVSGQVVNLKSNTVGLIKDIHITKGQKIKRGDLLFEFSSEEINIQIGSLIEQLRLALDNELRMCLDVRLAEQQITKSKFRVAYLNNKKKYVVKLSKEKFELHEQLFDINNDLEQEKLNMALLDTRLAYQSISQKLPLRKRASIKLVLSELKKELHQQFLLKHIATIDAYIYEVLTYPGQKVDEGTTLAIMLPNNKQLIEANVLETDLHELQIGKEVGIKLDVALTAVTLKGTVYSIVPATVSSLSVMPRNNTDSNWIKVSQRVPVLIEIKDTRGLILPIGSSAKIIIPITNGKPLTEQPQQDIIHLDTVKIGWKKNIQQRLENIMQHELAKINTNTYKNCNL